MVLVCHVISQDHVIKGLCDFMGRAPSRLSYHPARLCGNRQSGSSDIMIFVCHVIF